MDENISKMLYGSLIDAGCQGIKENDIYALDYHLRKHRQYLLDRLHKYQNEIDCLDYLLFQIEKEGEI